MAMLGDIFITIATTYLSASCLLTVAVLLGGRTPLPRALRGVIPRKLEDSSAGRTGEALCVLVIAFTEVGVLWMVANPDPESSRVLVLQPLAVTVVGAYLAARYRPHRNVGV